MIYEVRNHWFIKENEKIELTNLEHKLLMLLAKNFNKLVTYKEIAESVYNSDVKYVMNSIRVIKRRLKEKTKLSIALIKSEGYILTTEIYFK